MPPRLASLTSTVPPVTLPAPVIVTGIPVSVVPKRSSPSTFAVQPSRPFWNIRSTSTFSMGLVTANGLCHSPIDVHSASLVFAYTVSVPSGSATIVTVMPFSCFT